MPLSTPSTEVRSALNDLRAAARTLNEGTLTPPSSLDSDEAARTWALPQVARLSKLKEQHSASLTRLRLQAAAPRAPGDDLWRRVDEAFTKLESEFTSSSALKTRLAEGRRSMSSKAERVVQENLAATVELTGNRAEASLDATGVATLQDALPRWILGWADYAMRAYEVDLHRLIDRLWLTRAGELPVPRPAFTPLPAPPLPKPPEFPTVSQTIDLEGIGGVVKHARSVLYGVMSLGLIFGLRGGTSGEGGKVLMFGAAAAAFFFGYVQYRAEKASRVERFETDVGKRAEQAVKSVLVTWYDRQNDKLLEHCTAQLHERRRQLVQWYTSEVAPMRAREATQAAQQKQAAETARRQLVELERQTRDIGRAERALQRLTGAQ